MKILLNSVSSNKYKETKLVLLTISVVGSKTSTIPGIHGITASQSSASIGAHVRKIFTIVHCGMDKFDRIGVLICQLKGPILGILCKTSIPCHGGSVDMKTSLFIVRAETIL